MEPGAGNASRVLFLGVEGYVASTILDGAERRGTPKWLLAIGYATMFGLFPLLSAYGPGQSRVNAVHPSQMGWMGWGIAGVVAFLALWLAGIPYGSSRTGRILRRIAVAAAVLPIAVHFAGWI